MIGRYLWPSAEQKLLLRAALAEDGAALKAIAAWHARVDLGGTIDSGSFRLFPMAHANLEKLGCTHPAMAMLGGVRRRAWVEAQLRDRFAIEVIRELAARDIPTMVTKGLALAHSLYPDSALRPMSDIDLIVPPARAQGAISALVQLGFELPDGHEGGRITGHAVHLLRNGNEQVDLHVSPVAETAPAPARRWAWTGAVPLEIGGVAALRPGDSDLLLQVIVHGLRINPVPPLRWITDAAMIMRHGGPLDWDRIVDSAAKLTMSVRLKRALEFLSSDMDLPVPAGPLERLRGVRPKFYERLENAAISTAEGQARAVRWRWRAAIAGRLLSTGQIRHLRKLVTGFVRRRLPFGGQHP